MCILDLYRLINDISIMINTYIFKYSNAVSYRSLLFSIANTMPRSSHKYLESLKECASVL
jgi:hypothetical protein